MPQHPTNPRRGTGGDEFEEKTVITDVTAPPPARLDSPTGPAAMLVVLSGPAIGRNYSLGDDAMVIGRSGDVAILLPDEGVSRRHAEIKREGLEFWLTDLGSMNGTSMNGQRVSGTVPLKDGDRVLVGSRTIVKFCLMDSLEAEAQRRVTDAVYRDGLTGIYNRRYLDIRLREEFAFASRHGRPLALLIVDVDHFKKINDTYGHPTGDEVLRSLASCLEAKIRQEDVVARYGGEEFVIIGRGLALAQARAFAERVCGFVRALRVPHGEQVIALTVSIGCASYKVDKDQSVDVLLARADAALYEAKQAGRDRVVGHD